MKTLGWWMLMGGIVGWVGPVRADWEGTMRVSMPSNRTFEGTIRMKNDKLRIDMEKPMPMSSIVDISQRKAVSLVHPVRMLVETPFQEASRQIPSCKANEVDDCLKKIGYRAVGRETVDGQACVVMEAVHKEAGAPVKVRLWRPSALKEVPALRVRAETRDGVVLTEIRNVKMRPQSNQHFQVPSDYRSMKGMKLPGMDLGG